MLTRININLAESHRGTGITTGLPLVVKSHEYKFRKEHPETQRGVAKGNEKHQGVECWSEANTHDHKCSLARFNLDLMSFSFGPDCSGGCNIFYS